MAIFVPWLLDAALLTGYPVMEVPGWRERGHGGMTAVEGVVAHHTAGPRDGEYPSLGVVRDGRTGLAGPLANLGIGRSGTIYVVAAGLTWHAGESAWMGFSSLNSRFLGIEAESAGTLDDWTDAQRDCYPRLCAALLHYMRRNETRLAGHKEVAPGRKIDPAYWDMNSMRSQVATMLIDPPNRIPWFAAPAGGTVAVRDEVWGAPIPDYYKGGTATLPAFAALGWVGTHAARAKESADRAADSAAQAVALLRDIKAMVAAQQPAPVSEEFIQRIADAISAKDVENIATATANEIARRAQD